MSIKTRQKGGDEELKNLLLEKYGSEAKLGLVHKGSEASQLEVSFGEASKDKESGVWSWAWKGEDYPCSLQVRVKEGKVEKILHDGIKYDSDNPIKGSLAWCEKVLEKGEEVLKFSEKDKKFLKQSITKHLNEAGRGQGYRWFTSVDVAGDYCERYKECPSEWLDVVMTSKDGEWYTMDFVETYGAEKFGPWMWDVWVNVMRSDKVREAKSYDELHDLGERVGQTNKNKLQKEVANFWGDSDMKAKVAILGAVDALDDKTVEKWLVEILNAPVDRENSSVVYAAMEAIPSTEIKEKQYLLKLLDQIPAGRDNSEWADCRNQAIEFLGGKVEK